MFMGRFEHSIDAKGRLSIPSKFRETLGERYDARLVLTAYDGCLRAYPYAEWQVLEEKVAALPEFNKDTMFFLRYFYSSATECAIDRLGRILIPQTLRDYAKLEKDVVLLGAIKRIEFWSKAGWERNSSAVTSEEIVSSMQRLGL